MMTSANVVLAFAAWGLSQIKTIGCEHNYPKDRSEGHLWDFLRHHSYGLLDVVTGLTTEGKEWLAGNTRAKTAVVMPNPVLWPLPLNEPRLLPPVSERHIVLAAGRLVEQKSFDVLIEVFSGLAPVHSEWDLCIVGDGPLRPVLEQQIQTLGLQNRVFLPGRAGNISEWYERADLYVLSSRFEGLPMTLIEAMAYGVAVVSFDCNTGPRDIIRHEVDGLLVPPGDTAGLSAALDRLMGDEATRHRFAGRALEARERFSMASIAGLWEQLFEEPKLSPHAISKR
jgi:glycosyltransferase involved in cell wall biosynthesis